MTIEQLARVNEAAERVRDELRAYDAALAVMQGVIANDPAAFTAAPGTIPALDGVLRAARHAYNALPAAENALAATFRR